ncbi:MAG: hypothetical protein VX836_04215 [Pseudomonadota bacterium]|nr:hypothetical protein [Pseudomonadota bacterium]
MNNTARQHGLILASMLLLLSLLATLAIGVLWSLRAAESGASLARLSAQAFYAADSGIQWLRFDIAQRRDCPPSPQLLDGTELGLFEGSVTVYCRLDTHDDGGTPVRVYYLRADAERGARNHADAVSRRIDALLVE